MTNPTLSAVQEALAHFDIEPLEGGALDAEDIRVAFNVVRSYLSAQRGGVTEGWQPIESAPDDQELLLGWWEEWPSLTWKSEVGLYYCSKGRWAHGQAKYWMPLPKPAALAVRGGGEEPWNPATSPGHTDMMVSPETLDKFMQEYRYYGNRSLADAYAKGAAEMRGYIIALLESDNPPTELYELIAFIRAIELPKEGEDELHHLNT